ncbi:MAG: SRPBCC domain-containing protein [Xanthomonadaceae bacterium]|nr:SRPBCC domain-containing protein [Xanthomonadaceae bacterium]
MFDILHRVGIKTPIDEVYKALATPAGLAGWWTEETTGDEHVGGRLRFRFTDNGKELGVFNMKILELKANDRIVWEVVDGPVEWIGTRVRFDLKQAGDFTIVLFKHEGWKEPVEFMYHCSTKWATFLMSLKSLGETGKGRPSPNDVKIGDWH